MPRPFQEAAWLSRELPLTELYFRAPEARSGHEGWTTLKCPTASEMLGWFHRLKSSMVPTEIMTARHGCNQMTVCLGKAPLFGT